MNLTGSQLYSKAVQGLRSPAGGNLLDQQFRLIFLYPMLFDRRLHGNYSSTLRSFLSVSMLKEIFVNNALNIVAIASKDHPLVDEQGKKLDVQKMVKGSIVSSGTNSQYGGYGGYNGEATISAPRYPVDAHTLQQKINEKTAIIKKYLATDPRTKKLNPYVEIITLDNMVDVPVVVGTKDYQVDTLSLAFVLATALALKKPLNNWTNAQFVFNVIENTKQEDAWELFVSLVDKKNTSVTQRLIDYLVPSHPRIAGGLEKIKGILMEPMERFGKKVARLGQFHKTYTKPLIPGSGRSNRQSDPGKLRDQELDVDKSSPQKYVGRKGDEYDPNLPFKSTPQFDVMRVIKDNMSDTKLFFKFMLHDDLLRSQFGLDRSPGQMKTAVSKVSEHAQAMLQQSHHDFMTYMRGNVDVAMSAAFWTIYPWNSNADYSVVKAKYVEEELQDNIAEVVGELGGALHNAFAKSEPSEAMKRTNLVNKICQQNLERRFDEIGDLGKAMSGGMSGIMSHAFNEDQFEDFYKTLDHVTKRFNGIASDLRSQIERAIDDGDLVFNKATNAIVSSVNGMFKEYNKYYIPMQNNPQSNIAVLMNTKSGGQEPLLSTDVIPDYLEQLRDALVAIISAHFYVAALSAVCSFVDHISVEVETVSNDALDLPNYTLVVPVETIAMLHAAVISKSWRDLVSGGQVQNTNLTDNYIKGIVKFINKRLDVPNLIVIDSKKGHVYYKLQYMSQVNKTNMRTFETYVNSMTKNELQGNPY